MRWSIFGRMAVLFIVIGAIAAVWQLQEIKAGGQAQQQTGAAPAPGQPGRGANLATGLGASTGMNSGAKQDEEGETSSRNPGAAQDADSDPDGTVLTVTEPDSIAVLVNKRHELPDHYRPSDLVYPDVPFLFKDKIDKRKMRKPAAEALERLFAAAKEDGVHLAGVSAYRSYATQKALFARYVREDGEEKARTYSAVPGTSEHETGLAIDVSGSDGKCAAADCFAGTPEANWLAKHAAEYGFIVRYPEGKEAITGYKYEPWHIRYVGLDIAGEIARKGITLEEYWDKHGNPDGGASVRLTASGSGNKTGATAG